MEKFDQDEILEQAMYIFWEFGFHGTSSRLLQEKLNLHPGSIYNTFGNKSDLYQLCLRHYAKKLQQLILDMIKKNESHKQGLKAFFEHVLLIKSSNQPTQSCMLSDCLHLCIGESEIASLARTLFFEFQDFITTKFQEAIDQNQMIYPQINSTDLGFYIMMHLSGLRAMAVNGAPTSQIETALNAFFNNFSFPSPST